MAEPPLTRFKDWPKHKATCNKTGSTTQQPKVTDKKTVRRLFEMDEGQVEGLEDVERLLDAVMPEPGDLRRPVSANSDRARTLDIPAPGTPEGSIQITSSTLTPAFMCGFRDAASRLVNNAAESDGAPKRN